MMDSISVCTEMDTIFTPWKVKGKIDYMSLINKFGAEPLDEKIRLSLDGKKQLVKKCIIL